MMIIRFARWVCSNCGNSNPHRIQRCRRCQQKTRP